MYDPKILIYPHWFLCMVFCASDEPLTYGMPSQQEMPNTLSCFWKSVKITTFWTKVDVSQHWDSLNFLKPLENKTFGRFFSCFSDFFRCSKFPGSGSENKWICFGVTLFFRHSHISIRSLLGTTHRLFFFTRQASPSDHYWQPERSDKGVCTPPKVTPPKN